MVCRPRWWRAPAPSSRSRSAAASHKVSNLADIIEVGEAVNHIHDLLDRFRGHGPRCVTAAIAELLDQPLSRDPPRLVAKGLFDRGAVLLPAGTANRDNGSLGFFVEAAARTLGNGKRRSDPVGRQA